MHAKEKFVYVSATIWRSITMCYFASENIITCEGNYVCISFASGFAIIYLTK